MDKSDSDNKTVRRAHACQDLAQVRRYIDEIDQKLLDLLSLRSDYVHQVVRFKSREQIVDNQRIEAVIAAVREGARQRGIEPNIAENVWREMIRCFIALEEDIFARQGER